MSKIISWLVLIFVVLLALRVIAMRKASARRKSARATSSQLSGEPMVRCARCGVYLPRAEAKQMSDSYVCATACLPHG
jgi:uncharacterized protein